MGERSNLTNETENHSFSLVDQWIVTLIEVSLRNQSVTCTDWSFFRPGRLHGVERANRENTEYLTSDTFLKYDGADSPFCLSFGSVSSLYT